MRRLRRFGPLLLLGILIGFLAFIYDPRGLFDDDAAPPAEARGTSEAQIRSLREDYTADGTLGYSETTSTFAHVSQSSGAPVVTEIQAEGSTIGQGDVLWRIGFEPTVAFYGELPSYRDLGHDDEGGDVLQLETNLVALGFDPTGTITIDETFTSNTGLMVERWQEAIGAEVTGEVGLGAVVYIFGSRRVGEVAAEVGDSVSDGGVMMELTAAPREVALTVPASERASIGIGDQLGVRLPDASTITATVDQLVVGETGSAAVTAIANDAVPTTADQIPVTVSWSVELAADALTVPESALIRTDSTQYYVEVRDLTGSERLVAVEPGPHANGWVAITGEIGERDTVVAP